MTPPIYPDRRLTLLAVGGVYRNPDSIDNCNRHPISSPALDLTSPTGGNGQPVGVWGSFPPDCSQIAVKLHSDCSSSQVAGGCPGLRTADGQRPDSSAICAAQ